MKQKEIWLIEKSVRKVLREASRYYAVGRMFDVLGFTQVLDVLQDRERQVIEMRFGLDGEGSRTLEEVGKEFGVTRERIRQTEHKAFKKMKKAIKNLDVT